MFSISICPKCGQQVSIPSGVDREAVVRCPLCATEFPLGRALEFAMAGPPVLAPVGGVSEPKDEEIAAVVPAAIAVTPMVAASTIEPADVVMPQDAVVTADTAAEAALPSNLPTGEITFAAEAAPTDTVAVQPMEPLSLLPISDGAPAGVETVVVGAVGTQPADESRDPSLKQAGEEDSGGIYAVAGEKPQPAPAAVVDSRFDAVDNPYVDIFNDSPRPAVAAAPAGGATATLEEAHAAETATYDFGHPAPGAAAVAGAPAARGWQPRGKQRNPMRMMIGVIVSGLLGVAMAWLLFAAVRGCTSGSRRAQSQPGKQAAPAKAPKDIAPDDTDKKRWKGLPGT